MFLAELSAASLSLLELKLASRQPLTGAQASALALLLSPSLHILPKPKHPPPPSPPPISASSLFGPVGPRLAAADLSEPFCLSSQTPGPLCPNFLSLHFSLHNTRTSLNHTRPQNPRAGQSHQTGAETGTQGDKTRRLFHHGDSLICAFSPIPSVDGGREQASDTDRQSETRRGGGG